MEIFDLYFLDYYYIFLLFLLPIFLFLIYRKNKKANEFSFFMDLKKVYKNHNFWFYFSLFLFSFIFLFYIILFSNPNLKQSSEKITKNGIDIVVALDLSYSMKANDLSPNRLESAKKLINEFISKQNTNRVWLVVFAGKSFTGLPLTFDYEVLKQTVSNLSLDTINQSISWLSGTAIWDALLMSSNLFWANDDRGKVVLLLTDWEANVGLDPKISALKLKDKWVKIYSIWIWWEEESSFEFDDFFMKRQIVVPPLNDETLKNISDITMWKYYRAKDDKTFENIFSQLEKLEKNDIETEEKIDYKNYYTFFVITLLFMLFTFCFITFTKNNIE